MRQPLIDKAREFSQIEDDIASVEEDIVELQCDLYGDESEEIEKKARQLFDKVGMTNHGTGAGDKIEQLREEEAELKQQRVLVRFDLVKQATDITFPLDRTIDNRGDEVVFPYIEEIDRSVFEALEAILIEDFNKNGVSIESDAIVVDTDSTDEAIEKVREQVTALRQAAENRGLTDHLETLDDRDSKIAGMMITLRDVGRPLTKNELEEEMGLETGGLRGHLYYVVDNDPYLRKPDHKVELTAVGRVVISEYVNQFGEPTWESTADKNDEAEV